MSRLPRSLDGHRVRSVKLRSVIDGEVRYSPRKSLWILGLASAATVGGWLTFSSAAFALFIFSTAIVLLFGHSLGSHRKLIHDSYQCPRWLEYTLVYLGVQVGLAGPLGLLRQHELRDYAQRLPDCHEYLRHGRGFWRDGWWQLHCELHLREAPTIIVEERIANDRFYRFLERTWMWQQLPWALLFFAWGGWGYVFWGVCARVTAGAHNAPPNDSANAAANPGTGLFPGTMASAPASTKHNSPPASNFGQELSAQPSTPGRPFGGGFGFSPAFCVSCFSGGPGWRGWPGLWSWR